MTAAKPSAARTGNPVVRREAGHVGPAGRPGRRSSWSAAAAPLLIAVLAGCGASGSSGSPAAGPSAPAASVTAPQGGTTSPAAPSAGRTASAPSGQSGPVSPGHGSPADAVDGYYQALLAGNATLACSYVLGEEGPCPASVQATGHFTIGRTATSGALALVAVTGQICISGSGCMSNSNPEEGMPTGSETVSQAFADTTVTGNGFSPTPCEQSSHGGWYVSVNGG